MASNNIGIPAQTKTRHNAESHLETKKLPEESIIPDIPKAWGTGTMADGDMEAFFIDMPSICEKNSAAIQDLRATDSWNEDSDKFAEGDAKGQQ